MLSRPRHADPFLVQTHLQPPDRGPSPVVEPGPPVVRVERVVPGRAVQTEALLSRLEHPVFRPPEKLAPESSAREVPADRQPANVTGIVRNPALSLLVRPLECEGADGLIREQGKVHLAAPYDFGFAPPGERAGRPAREPLANHPSRGIFEYG